MNENVLKDMVNRGLSTYKIAMELGKSRGTVRYWLNYFGLNTKRVYQCATCNESNPLKFSKGRFSECKKCRGKCQNDSNRKRKKMFVEYKGGKCEICGYSKCMAALDFHHKNPNEKDPSWEKMRKRTFNKVKEELDKCNLVCRNCHSEIHYNIDNIGN